MKNKYEKKCRIWLISFFVSFIACFSLFFAFSVIPEENKTALTAIALLILLFCGLTFLSLVFMIVYFFKKISEDRRIRKIEDARLTQDEQYICPNCKKAYSMKVNFCPYCGTKKDVTAIPDDILFKGELSEDAKFLAMVKGMYYSSRINLFLYLTSIVVFAVLVGVSIAFRKINTNFYVFFFFLILFILLTLGNYLLLPWIIVLKSKGKKQNLEINEKEILCTNVLKAGTMSDSNVFELKYADILHAWKDKNTYYFRYKRPFSACFVMTYKELDQKVIAFLDQEVKEINHRK